MATITSIVDGNWNAAATWDLGRVPAASDTIMIAEGTHVTTTAEASVVGGHLIVNGHFTISKPFYLGNSTSKTPGRLTFGPGSLTDNIGGHAFYQQYAVMDSTSTSDNWATFRGEIKSTSETSNLFTKVDLQYVKFINSPVYFVGKTATSAVTDPICRIRNCVFEGGGRGNLVIGHTINNSYPEQFPAAYDLIIDSCDFRNVIGVGISGKLPNLGGAVRQITNCTFYNTSAAGRLVCNASINNSNANLNPVDLTGSVFINFTGGIPKSYFKNTQHISKSNFLSYDLADAGPKYVTVDNLKMEDSFLYLPPSELALGSTGLTIVPNLDGCVSQFENINPLSCVDSSQNYCSQMEIVNHLHIGNGDICARIPEGTKAQDWLIKNTTKVSRSGDQANSIWNSRDGVLTASSSGIKMRNNLHACLGVTPNGYLAGTSADNYVQALDADYNCAWNLSENYRSGRINNSGGTNDISADPQFVDPTRDFLSWVAYRSGTDCTDYTKAYEYVAGINGYDPETGLQDPAKKTHPVSDLVAWVRAGYVPCNKALESAGENGKYIGALPVGDCDLHEETVSIAADEQYMPGGTAENPALNRVPIVAPAGWTLMTVNTDGAFGGVVADNGQWFYVLHTPYNHASAGFAGGTAPDADLVVLDMLDDNDEPGRLRVLVSIADDKIVFPAPDSIIAVFADTQSWQVNFGVNVPGSVHWTDENGDPHSIGDTAVLPGYSVTVEDGSISVSRTGNGKVTGFIEITVTNSEGVSESRRIKIVLGSECCCSCRCRGFGWRALAWC